METERKRTRDRLEWSAKYCDVWGFEYPKGDIAWNQEQWLRRSHASVTN